MLRNELPVNSIADPAADFMMIVSPIARQLFVQSGIQCSCPDTPPLAAGINFINISRK